MITDAIFESIIAENERRWERLRADYDPVTGKGLDVLLGEKRVKLEISDFAIPEQWVPEEMMQNQLVKDIAKAGSIQKYIDRKRWKYGSPDRMDIERRLRRIRHRYDFCCWAYFCIRIKAKRGGRRIRFKLNYPQLIVLAECERMRRDGHSIDIIILKARQWGGSTFCFFYQVWLLFKWDEFHSFAIAAHTTTASETILAMLKRSISDYPAWDLGLPDDTQLRLAPLGTTGHAFVIKDQESKQILEGAIFIGTAEKPDTLRSKDIAGVHYSEVGIWPDTPEKRPEDLVADIQGGMLDDALSMQVMESSAKSPDDFFHKTWVESRAGEGGYIPIFVSFAQIEHDTKPIADEREFVEWLYSHKDDETREGRWKDSGKYHWWLWESCGATLEHINWYRYRRLKLSFAKMCNEAPATPDQAFFTAGNHVFDPFEVARKREKCRTPLFVGDLVSEGEKGQEALRGIGFVPNATGDLRIWEMPDTESPIRDRYLVVLDPRRGASEGADPACITVIDRLLMMDDFGLNGKPAVVAEMNYHADPDLQAYDAARLAEWYGHALLVIESNTMESMNKDRNNGIESFEYILDIVSSIYDHLYMRAASEEDIRKGVTFKWGFHTNSSTKPKIINFMKECLRDDLWDEPSEICCDQMATYMEDHGKTDAEHGNHDDAVMSRAIGLWVCYKEMPVPSWIKKEPKVPKEVIRGDSSGLLNM